MTDGSPAPARPRDCPGFLPFWAAGTVSGFGTYVTGLAIQVLVVLTLHDGAAEVGLVNAARWLPYMLFGVVVGTVIDRVRRRPLLIVADFVRAGLLVVIPVLALMHVLSVGALVAFMIVFGAMSLIADAASQSFLPRLVPPRLLTPAVARVDQSDAVAQTSGPALAGALVSLLTAPFAVLVDAGSYLVSGLLLIRTPRTEPPPRRVSLDGLGTEAREGLRWVYRHRMLRCHALGGHAWFLCFAIANAILPAYALRTLGFSAFGFGVALAAGGVGGLLGSLVATRVGARFGVGPVVVATYAGCGAGVAVMALAPDSAGGWVVFGVGELVLGLSMGAVNANEMGYRQAITPDHLQGRMNTLIRSNNRAAVVVGAPLGGLLADTVGFRPMLLVAALGFVVDAAALWASPYRTARLDVGDEVVHLTRPG